MATVALANLRNRVELLRDRVVDASAPLVAKLEPYTALAQDYWGVALPYLTKAFHYGFLPLIILLGMRGSPRPQLQDLINPV